jgi:hypothetical protein
MTSPTLMRLALQVLELALELNLDLNAIWVSRSDPRLQKADTLTKQVNSDDLFILTLFNTAAVVWSVLYRLVCVA